MIERWVEAVLRRQRSRTLLLTGSLLLVAAFTVVAGGPADAIPKKGSAPPCGTVVTTDLVLTGDMVCNGSALTIGAAGVTIDLNKHTITDTTETGTGITASSVNDVTVMDGRLEGFDIGVRLSNLSGATLDNVDVHLSSPHFFSGGIALTGVQHSLITGNTVYDPFIGISDSSGTSNTFSNNTIDHMGLNDPHNSLTGILVISSSGDLVTDNRIVGDPAGARAGDAIFIQQSAATTVTHNTVSMLGLAIADETTTGSVINDNTGYNNDEGLIATSPTQAVYENNMFNNNSIDGIAILSPSGVVLRNNSTNSNGSYGIHITGTASAVPTGNTANANSFGIVSQLPINVTGPTNHASGNHQANCVNVTPCS